MTGERLPEGEGYLSASIFDCEHCQSPLVQIGTFIILDNGFSVTDLNCVDCGHHSQLSVPNDEVQGILEDVENQRVDFIYDIGKVTRENMMASRDGFIAKLHSDQITADDFKSAEP